MQSIALTWQFQNMSMPKLRLREPMFFGIVGLKHPTNLSESYLDPAHAHIATLCWGKHNPSIPLMWVTSSNSELLPFESLKGITLQSPSETARATPRPATSSPFQILANARTIWHFGGQIVPSGNNPIDLKASQKHTGPNHKHVVNIQAIIHQISMSDGFEETNVGNPGLYVSLPPFLGGVLWVLTFPSCIGCPRPLLIAFTMKPWFLEQLVPCWQTCLCQSCSSESGLQLSIASARFEVKNQPWNFLPAEKMPFKPTHYLNPLLHHHYNHFTVTVTHYLNFWNLD